MVVVKNVISIENASIKYYDFERSLKSPLGKKISFTALKTIDADILEGEIIALLGRNGAGKSTLLKAIGGLIALDKGRIEVHGRVIILAGADPGFDPKISGIENVKQLGYAYGIAEAEINSFCNSIIEFAQLGEAINRNFGGYSSGMKGKLGFGFITALKPEILLIDETLGVGDREFRERAQLRLKDFISKSGTVIISTHSLGLAKEICSKGIVLDDGLKVYEGDISDAIKAYVELTD